MTCVFAIAFLCHDQVERVVQKRAFSLGSRILPCCPGGRWEVREFEFGSKRRSWGKKTSDERFDVHQRTHRQSVIARGRVTNNCNMQCCARNIPNIESNSNRKQRTVNPKQCEHVSYSVEPTVVNQQKAKNERKTGDRCSGDQCVETRKTVLTSKKSRKAKEKLGWRKRQRLIS